MAVSMRVYIEGGSKRAFACAVDWPGWCRSGRTEEEALQALLDSAPRYARAVKGTRLGFTAPKDVGSLRVATRIAGDATTDFGAPGATPDFDTKPMSDADLRRARELLRAAWRAFDAAARKAKGKTLAKGPRGGGRDLAAMIRHLVDADLGYLGGLGWKHRVLASGALSSRVELARDVVLDGLAASVRGEIPARGPRGGVRWKPRKFVRRSAWHWLDHAWEIEDRLR
jgi:hypothetical protein